MATSGEKSWHQWGETMAAVGEKQMTVDNGTTASMTTTSAKNASQIMQFKTSAIVRQGSGGGSNCKIVTGMVSTAATMSGRWKRRAIRSLRLSTDA
jgi:hypothetical protein